jgi:hypothetical protein
VSALKRFGSITVGALCSIASLTHARSACGQTVSGIAVDSATGTPIAGMVVVLLDSAGRQRGATLADSTGRFLLHAPMPGTYRVRSRQIGIASTTTSPVSVRGALPVSMILRVRPLAVTLPVVATVVKGRCLAVGETGDVGALWDEVGKALTAVTITPTFGTPQSTVSLRNFVRDLDPRTLAVRSGRTQDITAPAQTPYVSPAPDTLAKYGFVVPERDAFAAGHCLHARPSDPAHRGLIGVAFEPVQHNRAGDIHGSLWLDIKTSRLQYLEYTYTGEPAFVPDSLAGGRVEFMALPSGAWIVRHWVIRMPRFGRGYIRDAIGTYSIRATPDSVLAGVVEVGGTVLAQGDTALSEPERTVVAMANRPDTVVQRGTAMRRNAVLYGSVLSDPNNRPVVNAEVMIAQDHGARTDTAGQFRIMDVPPGRYDVAVRHLGNEPMIVSVTLAAGDSLARDFVLAAAPPAVDTVSVRAQTLRSPIGLGKMAGFESRRQQGIGRFVDTTTLGKESYRSLGEILRAHFSIGLFVINGSGYVAGQRGMVSPLDQSQQPSGDASDRARGAKPACYAQIYLDGVRVYNPRKDVALFDVNSVQVTSVQAVEYFAGPAETPAVYGGTGASCGTVLIWTR